MRRLLQVISYYFVNALFFVGALVLNLLSAALLLLPRKLRPVKGVRAALRGLFRFWLGLIDGMNVCRFEFEDLQKYSDKSPRIWVMNHPTIADGVYLLSLLPRSICIYKGSIAANPFYGFIAKLALHLPSSPGPDMIRDAVDRLNRGEQLIVFPEGTRRENMDTSSMKGGFALMAIRAKAKVELLWIDNPRGFRTKESNPWRPPEMPAKIRISRFGCVEPEPHESATHLMKRVAAAYDQQIEAKTNRPYNAAL